MKKKRLVKRKRERLRKGDRDPAGRFQKGCRPGPGNPLARQCSQLRAELLLAVTRADIRAIVRSLVKRARAGSLPAVKLLLERTCGKPTVQVDQQFIDSTDYYEPDERFI